MRLPHRVPWRSISELDEVCSWIYSPQADDASKSAAVNRLAAWRCAMALPHSLESTWMILGAMMTDKAMSGNPAGSSLSGLVLRQAYAIAIVRLVNGLVDPLQQGIYARPIAAIAAQIGLPGWLVEIRHAATHEDLPSLTLLREAADESLGWLLQNYWIPTISPDSGVELPPLDIPSLAPLLKEYKALLKLTTRDASLKTRHKADIVKLHRQVERWIGEVKVAFGLSMGQQTDEEEKERLSVEQLCEALLIKGVLVPVSKKKRVEKNEHSLAVPPNVVLWDQLLEHIQVQHPTFGANLISQILAHLFSSSGDDPTADECLAGWVLWLCQSWGNLNSGCSAEDTALGVLGEYSRLEFEETPAKHLVSRILMSLTYVDETVRKKAFQLLEALQQPQSSLTNAEELTLETMEARAAELLSRLQKSRKSASDDMLLDEPSETLLGTAKNPAPGIRLLGPENGWKPCPIGMDGTSLSH